MSDSILGRVPVSNNFSNQVFFENHISALRVSGQAYKILFKTLFASANMCQNTEFECFLPLGILNESQIIEYSAPISFWYIWQFEELISIFLISKFSCPLLLSLHVQQKKLLWQGYWYEIHQSRSTLDLISYSIYPSTELPNNLWNPSLSQHIRTIIINSGCLWSTLTKVPEREWLWSHLVILGTINGLWLDRHVLFGLSVNVFPKPDCLNPSICSLSVLLINFWGLDQI